MIAKPRKKKLSPTALPGDGLAQTYENSKHVGDNDTWKELHGGVEGMLNTGNSHHNDIARQS